MKDNPKITQEEAERVADLIVERLFTNGIGIKAERLVLIDPDGRDQGGWGQGPAKAQIVKVLLEGNSE